MPISRADHLAQKGDQMLYRDIISRQFPQQQDLTRQNYAGWVALRSNTLSVYKAYAYRLHAVPKWLETTAFVTLAIPVAISCLTVSAYMALIIGHPGVDTDIESSLFYRVTVGSLDRALGSVVIVGLAFSHFDRATRLLTKGLMGVRAIVLHPAYFAMSMVEAWKFRRLQRRLPAAI